MAGVDPSFRKSKTYTIVKASLQKKNKLQNAMVKGLGAAGLGGLHFLIFALSVGLFSFSPPSFPPPFLPYFLPYIFLPFFPPPLCPCALNTAHFLLSCTVRSNYNMNSWFQQDPPSRIVSQSLLPTCSSLHVLGLSSLAPMDALLLSSIKPVENVFTLSHKCSLGPGAKFFWAICI